MSFIENRVGGFNIIEVWVMKEYGVEGSWSKQCCLSASYDLYFRMFFMFMTKEMKCEWSLNGQLRFEDKQTSYLDSVFDGCKLHPELGVYMFNYRESLVPIHRIDEDQFRFGW
ncbi:hypothetical protein TorRG33x02_259750 [Trema orientale]|uniref:F-box associated domain n=1 Tax=Trema orientale TaxID=63057 RepID=A0A2P5D7E2_TREOI|nr:hypothetical protein TorRG33x02_259750 [Trema orientale]